MADSTSIKKFRDGDTLFKEGEPSGSAYVIVKGCVELTKDSKHGAVLLARLKVGELFGEMGIIDGSPRSATARVVGDTAIKEISPEALLNGIQNDPDLSSKVMGKLVERLRAADEMLAKAGVSRADGTAPRPQAKDSPSPAAPAKKKGFLSRLFSSKKGREATYEIVVADFLDDEDHKITEHFFQALKQCAENLGGGVVNIRRANAPFSLADFSDNSMAWGQIKAAAQRWLSEEEGDLLLWGQVRARGQVAHLRISHGHPLLHTRAGYIQPCDAFDLPAELDDVLAGYLYAISVGAIVPSDMEQRDSFEAILGPALDTARPALQKRLRQLDPDEQVRFEVAFANLLATCGLIKRRTDRFKEAEQTYLKALRSLRRSKSDLLPGVIKRHLGFTQSNWVDIGGETDLLEAAVESLREACEYFDQSAYPQEWSEMQVTIGQLLYKKDQKDGDSNALKESITAYRSALQVLTATANPRRWAEAKHHLARSLQLLGSQTGDLDMIARSAEACKEALVVRNKKQSPMLWAATQNNLGSALFMLCQKTRKPETAEAAIKAFESALEIYEIRKAVKLAKVTQKNLARAREVSVSLGPIGSSATTPDSDDFGLDDFEDANK